MTIDEKKQYVLILLKKAPPPEKIATIASAVAFKNAAKKANMAKSAKALDSAITLLNTFYK